MISLALGLVLVLLWGGAAAGAEEAGSAEPSASAVASPDQAVGEAADPQAADPEAADPEAADPQAAELEMPDPESAASEPLPVAGDAQPPPTADGDGSAFAAATVPALPQPIPDVHTIPGSDPCGSSFCVLASFVLDRQRDDLHLLAALVSDPKSPFYGRYWSVEDVARTFGASQSVIDGVVSYLDGMGALNVAADVTRTLVTSVLLESQLNALWGTSWQTEQVLPVPGPLAGLVTAVQPLGFFKGYAVTIQKVTSPAGSTERFMLIPGSGWPVSSSPTQGLFTLADGEAKSLYYVQPYQTYQVTENVPAGWTLAVSGDGCTPYLEGGVVIGVEVTPNAAQEIACTFTNTVSGGGGGGTALPAAAVPAVVPAWPEWAFGSGTPEACPLVDLRDCFNVSAQELFGTTVATDYFTSLTPAQLRAAYGVSASGLTGAGGRAVVLEFGQMASGPGFDLYASGFGLGNPGFTQTSLLGGYAPLGLESILDVETIVGIAPGLEHLTLLNGTGFPNAVLFSAALDPANTGGVLTHVISVSWGDVEQGYSGSPGQWQATVDPQEHVLQTAAAAGVTVVAAAGDYGSSDAFLDGINDASVNYPASSVWSTSAGGTNLVLNADNSINSSEVWNDWYLVVTDPTVCADAGYSAPCRIEPDAAGGGGQSAFFARPWYQAGVSAPGLAGGSAPYRLVPDIAFLADVFPATVLCAEVDVPTSPGVTKTWCFGQGNGTSQATPMFAAMVLLLNEQADQTGQPHVGFANPLLYSLGTTDAAVFWDIVTGNNVLGDQTGQFDVGCCIAGPGFDMASGWGSLLIDRVAGALREPLARLVSSTSAPTAGNYVLLVAGVFTPGGKPVWYAWDLDGDGGADRLTSTPLLVHRFDAPGRYEITVLVQNSLGRRATSEPLLVEVAGEEVPGAGKATEDMSPHPTAEALAFTGPSDVVPLLVIALAALLLGAVCLAVSRREPAGA
ncbi:MAG: hypothetical protein JJLCMIEE_00528 [Acidimicrobiales bacterium]|nr:hypothetical protein [Acidimicrobiales bacterium]